MSKLPLPRRPLVSLDCRLPLPRRLAEGLDVDPRAPFYDTPDFDTFLSSDNPGQLARRGHAKSIGTDLLIVGLAVLVSWNFHIPLFSKAYNELKKRVLGKRILFTDRQDLTDEEIIFGYRRNGGRLKAALPADARPPPSPRGLRLPGPLALLLAPYLPERVARRSRLAIGPGSLQQNAKLFLRRSSASGFTSRAMRRQSLQVGLWPGVSI